jgi:hypothetical protein
MLTLVSLFKLVVGIPLARINFSHSVVLLMMGIALMGIFTPLHLRKERRKKDQNYEKK